MSNNPYQTPNEFVDPASPTGGSDDRLDLSINMLRETRPWVRCVSVVMFLGSGFMVFGGIAAMFSFVGAFGLLYVALAGLYIVPAIFLWRFAERINVALRERSAYALGSALEAQKSFWKFVGITMLIILGLYGVLFVVGMATTMSRF